MGGALLPVLFLLLFACIVGVIYPYIPNSKRWQFALGATATFVAMLPFVAQTEGAVADGKDPPLGAFFFLFLLLAALVGVAYPFIPNSKRWQFGIGAVASFVGIGLTAPPLTPEEVAAKEAEETREAADEAKHEADEAHQTVVSKAQPGLQSRMGYTRAEFGETYKRVGAVTFAKLNDLEPGAAYAAAESRSCNKVMLAMVSDTSKPGNAVWFVDCVNENRFMIAQAEAESALERFREGKLALRKLEPSCTVTSVAYCKLTPAQRTAKKKETEYVSACDMILQTALISPSSLDLHGWNMSFGSGDKVVIERAFDSQNSFGAMLRGSYRCEIRATNSRISRFEVRGPAGSERVI